MGNCAFERDLTKAVFICSLHPTHSSRLTGTLARLLQDLASTAPLYDAHLHHIGPVLVFLARSGTMREASEPLSTPHSRPTTHVYSPLQ